MHTHRLLTEVEANILLIGLVCQKDTQTKLLSEGTTPASGRQI